MFLKPLELTIAHRPLLLQDETSLFVQNLVGLYEGKNKLPDQQNGQVYLTTHRVCYVDEVDPRKHSVAIELENVDKYEFYARFLKSSPKITFHPKQAKHPSFQQRSDHLPHGDASRLYQIIRSTNSSLRPNLNSPDLHPTANSSPKPRGGTWVCPICSFSNMIPESFDPTVSSSNYPIAPCQACGINPTFAHILKAAIANASGRQSAAPSEHLPRQVLPESYDHHDKDTAYDYRNDGTAFGPTATSPLQCPRCTFLNHPSLSTCEICGSPISSNQEGPSAQNREPLLASTSPGQSLAGSYTNEDGDPVCIKVSFRAGGEKVFYDKLKGAMVQRKWLLQKAPPIPEPVSIPANDTNHANLLNQPDAKPNTERARSAGIAGLERRGFDLRKKNEAMIGSAFEDLDALMASAKEIIELAESFAKDNDNGFSSDATQVIAESARSLDMVTTKDMLGSNPGSESLYLAELSRNLAEYLTDDSKGILMKEGGVMTLVDLWAVFNRARGGVELINPTDFEKAAKLWGKLRLPVRLRRFKNGLLVVQHADRTDDKTIAQLLDWLQELHALGPSDRTQIGWDWATFGKGISAQEAAQRFGWSIGVASEELEMAEEKGLLCRQEGVEGLRFWENWLVDLKEEATEGITVGSRFPTSDDAMDDIVLNLKASGLL